MFLPPRLGCDHVPISNNSAFLIQEALVLGAGGTARAAMFALQRLASEGRVALPVRVANRTLKKAEDLATEFEVPETHDSSKRSQSKHAPHHATH